ncbi:MAG: prolyl oligopeptidase family serine peptidase [Candidatus Aureabacteria bacterium]|nr:prolyl oligopeptidase family serine peptidase [Candidatus Auribacterota bacterium]
MSAELFFLSALVLFPAVFLHTRIKDATQAHIFKDASGKKIPYRIYIPPGLRKKKKYPLVLFFHGSLERGSDNLRQMSYGIRELIGYSKSHGEPVFMLAPQCSRREEWVKISYSGISHKMAAAPTNALKLAMALLDDTVKEKPIDTKRIYVVGLSMGGFAVWDIIERRPEYFAAAIPICGGGDISKAGSLAKIPIWAFHGELDDVVAVRRSRSMIDAIRKKGGKPFYTEYPDGEHDAWVPTFKNKKVFEWLLKQRKRKGK